MRRLNPAAWLAPVTAGFIAVLVGYTGAAIIVVQAFVSSGATPALVGSWMTMLGLSMAATTLAFSLVYRQPILTAWSTPGAALLIVAVHGHTVGEAVGAFMVCGALVAICGFTGLFARFMDWIPGALASAMLAGVLLHFGLSAFSVGAHDGWIFAVSVAVWWIARRLAPRYATLLMLIAGTAAAVLDGRLSFARFDLAPVRLATHAPIFSLGSVVGIGLPLFVVTMASQNAPGVAMLRSAGYRPPVSMILTVTGLATIALAPFGGFVTCLAAITAGICLSPEATADPAHRYRATLAAAFAYALAGSLGASIAGLLHAMPAALTAVLAGLALLPAIAGALAGAIEEPKHREAAVLTFLVTASDVHIAGIGAPFWGLIAGLAAVALWSGRPLAEPARR